MKELWSFLFCFEEMTSSFVKHETNKKCLCYIYCDTTSMVNMLSFLQSIRESIHKKNREKTIFCKNKQKKRKNEVNNLVKITYIFIELGQKILLRPQFRI